MAMMRVASMGWMPGARGWEAALPDGKKRHSRIAGEESGDCKQSSGDGLPGGQLTLLTLGISTFTRRTPAGALGKPYRAESSMTVSTWVSAGYRLSCAAWVS